LPAGSRRYNEPIKYDRTLRSWQKWAGANDVSVSLRALAEYRWAEFHGEAAGDVAQRIVRYAVRLPDELAAAMRQVAERCPSIVTCQPYLRWAEGTAA